MDITPIGTIRSPYHTRFGIPRQAGLVPAARFFLEIPASEDMKMAVRGLSEFSHIWVIFRFHKLKRDVWKPLVQPPRLGGNVSVGVLATRSPYRPNGIGMSAVKLVSVDVQTKKSKSFVREERIIRIEVLGGDFLDGTPILDIKPYIAYADAIESSVCAWASPQEASLDVVFSDESEAAVVGNDALRNLIVETLRLDPRPGYERGNSRVDGRTWGMHLCDHDIRWTVCGGKCEVLVIEKIDVNQ